MTARIPLFCNAGKTDITAGSPWPGELEEPLPLGRDGDLLSRAQPDERADLEDVPGDLPVGLPEPVDEQRAAGGAVPRRQRDRTAVRDDPAAFGEGEQQVVVFGQEPRRCRDVGTRRGAAAGAPAWRGSAPAG